MIKDRVYIMVSLVRPWLYKLGVSNRVDLRERQVGARSIFAVRLPFAYSIEGALHAYLKPTNVHTWGSGATEWHLSCNPIIALLFLNAQLWYGVATWLPPYAPVVLFLLPIPLDAIVILAAIAVFAYGVMAMAIILFVFMVVKLLLLRNGSH